MKKLNCLLACVLLFFCCTGSFAQSGYYSLENSKKVANCPDCLVFLSHNACNFGGSKDDETIKEMAKLYSPADLFTLQEVSTNKKGADAAARLADELNRSGDAWDYAISDPTGGTATERYAYFFKKSKFELIAGKDGKRVSLWSELSGVSRPPASALFKIKNGNGKLIEINSLHLAPTEKNPANELAHFADSQMADRFSAANQIIAGDFNMSSAQIDPILRKALGFVGHIDDKTSLGSSEDNLAQSKYFSKAYDNIYTEDGIQVRLAGVIDFANDFESLKEARLISDHLPVFILFKAE